MKFPYRTLLTLAILTTASYPILTTGQDSTDTTSGKVLVNEGIAGYADKKDRNPVLSVRAVVEEGNVKLLADAEIKVEDLRKFPIRFDFFVNRSLVTSQIRSPELPGPVGIDVSSRTAAIPFNYAVIATLLHPNRQYVSSIYGAVFGEDLTASGLSCTLSIADSEGNAVEYTKSNVSIDQPTADTVSFSFNGATTESSEDTASASGTASISGTSASGSLTISSPAGDDTVSVTGTAEKEAGTLKSLTLSSEDEGYVLGCN